MSRAQNSHRPPCALTKTATEIEIALADIRQYDAQLKNEMPEEDRRKLYHWRLQAKSKVIKLTRKLKRLKHRAKPAPAMPLFKSQGRKV